MKIFPALVLALFAIVSLSRAHAEEFDEDLHLNGVVADAGVGAGVGAGHNRIARGTCDPNTCDSNCRYCFNGKCDCNHK